MPQSMWRASGLLGAEEDIQGVPGASGLLGAEEDIQGVPEAFAHTGRGWTQGQGLLEVCVGR